MTSQVLWIQITGPCTRTAEAVRVVALREIMAGLEIVV